MRKTEDLTGRRFGKLFVIEPAEAYYTKTGGKKAQWRCRCDCGRERIVRASYLKRGDATYCGMCEPLRWGGRHHRLCRNCVHSEWDAHQKAWTCRKDADPSEAKSECDQFWCAPEDKLSGTRNRASTCFVCGKPIYTVGNRDVPIYCEEHREYAERDSEIIREAPKELLFSLVAGIFLQARTDYLTNKDGQRSDAELFLTSNWAQDLSLDGFDAMKVLESLNEEMKDGTGRIKRSDSGEG